MHKLFNKQGECKYLVDGVDVREHLATGEWTLEGQDPELQYTKEEDPNKDMPNEPTFRQAPPMATPPLEKSPVVPATEPEKIPVTGPSVFGTNPVIQTPPDPHSASSVPANEPEHLPVDDYEIEQTTDQDSDGTAVNLQDNIDQKAAREPIVQAAEANDQAGDPAVQEVKQDVPEDTKQDPGAVISPEEQDVSRETFNAEVDANQSVNLEQSAEIAEASPENKPRSKKGK